MSAQTTAKTEGSRGTTGGSFVAATNLLADEKTVLYRRANDRKLGDRERVEARLALLRISFREQRAALRGLRVEFIAARAAGDHARMTGLAKEGKRSVALLRRYTSQGRAAAARLRALAA